MSHRLMLFCGPLPVLEALRATANECRLYSLLVPGSALAVLPIVGAYGDANLPEQLWYGPIGHGAQRSLVESDIRFAAAASERGPLAYIETDYFGRAGYQSAALWRDGALVMALATEGEAGDRCPEESPINRALRGLGVVAGDGRDEFLTVGLGGYRSNDDIVNEATEAAPPAPTDAP